MKPILFSTAMVQAILEGRKTQTRRIIKPQPTKQWAVEKFIKEGTGSVDASDLTAADLEMDDLCNKRWSVGDVLWVREKWKPNTMPMGWPHHYYAANDTFTNPDAEKWKPSIFMPKDACRLFLKITDIRVERLQEISEADAIAEGVESNECDENTRKSCPSIQCTAECGGKGTFYRYPIDECKEDFPCESAVESFETLWTSINGVESWNLNPWVWVVSFEKTDNPNYNNPVSSTHPDGSL